MVLAVLDLVPLLAGHALYLRVTPARTILGSEEVLIFDWVELGQFWGLEHGSNGCQVACQGAPEAIQQSPHVISCGNEKSE